MVEIYNKRISEIESSFKGIEEILDMMNNLKKFKDIKGLDEALESILIILYMTFYN